MRGRGLSDVIVRLPSLANQQQLCPAPAAGADNNKSSFCFMKL